MIYTQNTMDEINLLAQFNLSTTFEGIKIHQHTASETLVNAAQRLYDKGLITQKDGGYLTHLGREAAEHAQMLLRLLEPIK